MEGIVEEELGAHSSKSPIISASSIKITPGAIQSSIFAGPDEKSVTTSGTLVTLPIIHTETEPLLTRISNQVESSQKQKITSNVLGKWGNANKMFNIGQDDSKAEEKEMISHQKKSPGTTPSWKHLIKKVEILERATTVWQKGEGYLE